MKNAFYSIISFLLRIPDIVFYALIFFSLVVIVYYDFHLGPDMSIQLHTLKNFVNGNGISLTSLDINNNIIYLPCSLWPAGLVIFLSPLYLITKSAIASELILMLIGNAFFIFFLAKYFEHLKLGNYKKKLILLFFVFAVAPFVEFSTSDTIATVLCLWGFYFSLKYQQNEKYRNVLFSLIFIGIAYFVKYSFLPFLLYPLLAFILKEKANTFKRLKQFLIIFSTTIATVLFFYILNYLIVGKMQMSSSFDCFKGNIHWNQLSHFNGFLFVFGSVYQWVFENLVKNHLGINFHFNWLSIAITLYFYYLFTKEFFTKKNTFQNAAIQNSINISLSAGALIIGFLTFLTLNNPAQTWSNPYWTFVEETRYYGPVIIIGFLNILILFFNKNKGYLLHVLVPIIVILNLYAYKTVVQNGFWGKNYQSYISIKNAMNKELPQKNNLQVPVVYFNEDTKNSDPYFYLQSHGIILLDKSKKRTDNSNNVNLLYYDLKLDSSNKIIIARIN